MWTNELPTKPGVYLWRPKEGVPARVRTVQRLFPDGLACNDDATLATVDFMKGQWCDFAAALDRISELEKRLEETESALNSLVKTVK